jgi:ABC-type multidrug transport system ATPase subunit
VYKNSSTGLPAFGLRIKDLSKTFSKIFSKNKVEAIKNFCIEIESNELMGILGHNGAGKTTLINILTGIISPDNTQGLEIIINNKNIEKIDEIRKYIGMCSQFDILWNEMTAEEHLHMFAKLKGVPPKLIPIKIN